MKRQMYRQRRRRVAFAATSVALVGALGACDGSTEDTKSTAPATSASTEASAPDKDDSEPSSNNDAPAAESEESAEKDPDEPLNFAKDPSLVALFGQSVNTYGIIVTAEEPKPRPDLADEWEAGGVVKKGMEYITIEIAVENTLNAEAPVAGTMGSTVFSGESEGEYLSNSGDDQEAPKFVPAGRIATWVETFAVEDADDVYLSLTTPTESTVPFVTQTQMDLIEGEVSTD